MKVFLRVWVMNFLGISSTEIGLGLMGKENILALVCMGLGLFLLVFLSPYVAEKYSEK